MLVLHLSNEQAVVVGRLGSNVFPAGYYLYTGSALGPGGLAGRLGRHLRPASRPHWHIDYLRQHAGIEEIWLAASTERLEHEWATAISQLPGAAIPMPRFGASDCRCPAHLFHFIQKPGQPVCPPFTSMLTFNSSAYPRIGRYERLK